MSIGDLPESLTQAMLVGTMLIGRWGVHPIHMSRIHAIEQPREFKHKTLLRSPPQQQNTRFILQDEGGNTPITIKRPTI